MSRGMAHTSGTATQVDHVRNAYAYDAMLHEPWRIEVIGSYTSFKRTILQQWDVLRTVIDFERWAGTTDSAYANSAEMMADVAQHGHLWVYGTDASQLDPEHFMSAAVPASMRQDDLPLVNDVFRGVHDIMGHVRSQGSFGVNGEYKAWLAHRSTMPAQARLALWCETRGQSAWTNAYGDHASLPLSHRPFAEQKSGVVDSSLI